MTTRDSTERLDWPAIALVFAGAIAIFAVRSWSMRGGPFFADTDDAMRMVRVRDLLAGQNWYDWVQHRLNTPFGAEVHWSRLVDAPLAVMLAVLTPFFGTGAERILGYAWPLLLIVCLLVISGRLAYRLAGSWAILPALLLPVLSPAVTVEFAPGRIDHHNVQIILTLALAWASVEGLRRPGFATAAGLVAASALAIGTEALPSVAAAIIGFGLVFVLRPAAIGSVVRFGLAFGLASLVHLSLALPPSRWLVPACDAISAVYVGSGLIVGVTFLVLGAISSRLTGPIWRLLAGLVIGVAGIGLIAVLFPQCLGGPYAAVDPWLTQNWINTISEAKPWWESLDDLPAYTLSAGIPPLLGLLVIGWRAYREPRDRGEWLLLGLFLVVATLVMLAQVRGARLSTMLAIPAAAWLIASSREAFLARKGLLPALGFLLGWLGFAGVLVAFVVNGLVSAFPGRAADVLQARANRVECLVPDAFAALAALAPTGLMTPVDLGAHALLETGHSVVAAPYHRNGDGVRDTFDFFHGPIGEARDILERRGIGMVVICPAMAEMGRLGFTEPDSLVERLLAGDPPDWLDDLDFAGALEVYAVIPAR